VVVGKILLFVNIDLSVKYDYIGGRISCQLLHSTGGSFLRKNWSECREGGVVMVWMLDRGARLLPDGTVRFNVWAPRVHRLALQFTQPRWSVPMTQDADGVHTALVRGLSPGDRYSYRLDETRLRPDPVSRWQPDGVHGPSAIVDPDFRWTDHEWKGIALHELILYELHCGTFTKEGTFTAIIPLLDYLKNELGLTAVELMPVAAFPGSRNWGYDGVHPFAPQHSYGGPLGLKTLVNACHEKGLAVILDVVYNHLGPEGNYLSEFAPYFTDRYHTPWGQALNFDGDDSTEVRRYFIDNALYWVTEFHIDGLRLDAIHGIYDASEKHVLQELAEVVHAQASDLGRTIHVISESDLNDNCVITSRNKGGWGHDAQWSDDFHHSLHALLTKERDGYYHDFGSVTDLQTAITDGFVYQGRHSPYRQRPHGTPSRHLPGERFVICSQNHDQVGNRAYGDRLSTLISFPALKLAAGLVLCAPNIPLLFMGEEYGEPAPFLYFTSHTDPDLAQAVRDGRRREFARFAWAGEIPDPQDPQTFARSQLNHALREQGQPCALLRFYRDLIAVRKRSPALANCNKETLEAQVIADADLLLVRRWQPGGDDVLLFASFASEARSAQVTIPKGHWLKTLEASANIYGGSAGELGLPSVLDSDSSQQLTFTPYAFALYWRDPQAG
jgi:maltooligosyltrehalose trehalohydrolase